MFAKAVLHFKKVDPILYRQSLQMEPILLEKAPDYFTRLTRSITGQQLSGKVATVIFARFQNLFPNQKITAEGLLEIPDEAIRNIGMAWSKVRSLKDLAAKVVSGEVDLNKIEIMDQEEVIRQLTLVKGIGPWTAEMFMMFALAREDIFSFGDLGLQNAIKKLYSLEKKPTAEEMKVLSEKWSPYRTYAALILWDSLDNRPA